MTSDKNKSLPKTVLIITSSGGGGLLQAAKAKEQELRLIYPDVKIVRRDLLKDWTWKRFGSFCIQCWNGAQLKGNVKAQKFWLASQVLAEYIFWPHMFYCTLKTLLREDIDKVIDTQPIGTSAILKAIRIYNRRKKKKVILEKVLVDLPTKKATHFFRPIKMLTSRDRKILKLTTIKPLLEEGQTEKEFWKKNCRLTEKEIQYEDVYVRQAFKKFYGKKRGEEGIEISLQYKSLEELQLMQKVSRKGPIHAEVAKGEFRCKIDPKDRVFTVLLGSQPAGEATLSYVKKFLHYAKEENSLKTPTHLFVFAADHVPGQDTLFKKISDFISRMKVYPPHFSVIPFSFQTDEAIAPIFFRSDLTITRSGGQTAMELMCVSSGAMWIHSETKKEGPKDPSMKKLLSGIPGWEAENAVYLQKLKNAKIVTPEIMLPFLRKLDRSSSVQALPSFCPESIAQ